MFFQLFSANAEAPFAWSLVLAGAVVMISIVPLGAARAQSNFSLADLAAPRSMFDRYPAWGKRASWAHQNCFEAFGLHAPAAILALIAAIHAGPLSATATIAALAHPFLRLFYIGAYVGNIPPLRAFCWASALLCSGLLYLEGLRVFISS